VENTTTMGCDARKTNKETNKRPTVTNYCVECAVKMWSCSSVSALTGFMFYLYALNEVCRFFVK
jgi:hypothetical protein